MMKKLSDFKDERGIEIAAEVLGVIMEILADQRNKEAEQETVPIRMFTTFLKNSPAQMRRIFAILSEEKPEAYHCDGSQAMMNMMLLANDPVLISLFISQGQTRGATSSGSASENTAE
jgi:hypothetical protein